MWKFAALLFVVPGIGCASGLLPVVKTSGFCAANSDSYCYEWTVESIPALRFVAHGDEDVIEYGFYELAGTSYMKVADVFPLLEDPSRPDRVFWGYPWDIKGIRIGVLGGQPALLASSTHGIAVSDEYGQPTSGELRAAILFTGRSSQPESERARPRFRAVLPSRLRNDG